MERVKRGRWWYILICCPTCNQKRYVRKDVFNRQGATKCLKCSNKKHGFAINARNKINQKNWLYARWQKMKCRCKKYPTYISKGITVCQEWENNFENFYKWACNNGAKKNLELDRKDNSKGYTPENCRWVTHKENCRPGGRSPKAKR